MKEFLALLREPEQYQKSNHDLSNESVVDSLLHGFAKYMSYLSDYKAILTGYKRGSLPQSAVWTLESYWFVRLNDKMGSYLRDSIGTVRGRITSGVFTNFGDRAVDPRLVAQWQKESLKIVDESIKNTEHLMDLRLGKAVLRLVRRR